MVSPNVLGLPKDGRRQESFFLPGAIGSAPRLSTSCPCSGETLLHKLITEGAPVAYYDAELATISVLVSITHGRDVKCALIQEFDETICRSVPEGLFAGAAWLTYFRRVDVSYADFSAIEPQRITVHDASDANCATVLKRSACNHVD